MAKKVTSVYIAGTTGVGKSYGVGKWITDFGLNGIIIDFEDNFECVVDEHFSEFKDQFDIKLGYVERTESNLDIKKTSSGKMNKSSMSDFGFLNTPDWGNSFDYLKELIEDAINRTDYDVLVYEGGSPIIRNDLGLAKWKRENPDRSEPIPKEWAPMNNIESKFIEAGKYWAKKNNKLFIITGQLKEEFKNDKKIGEVPALTMKLQHKMDVSLWFNAEISMSGNKYTCTCMDSIKGQWVENLTMDRHISDILIERGLIGND